MTLQLAYNTTGGVVLVDELGHSIGGRDWGVVDTTDAIGKEELATGRLVLVDEDGAAASDRAEVKAALASLAARRQRTEEARGLDKTELMAQLPEEVVSTLPLGGDGLPAKDDLVAAAAAEADSQPAKSPRRGQK